MEKIIQQLAEALGADPAHISNVRILDADHLVFFCYCEADHWAKLSENNRSVRKNSVRKG